MNRFSSPALAPASPEVEKRVSQKLMLKGITWGSVLLSAGWPAKRVSQKLMLKSINVKSVLLSPLKKIPGGPQPFKSAWAKPFF